jgi:hypothetical protein
MKSLYMCRVSLCPLYACVSYGYCEQHIEKIHHSRQHTLLHKNYIIISNKAVRHIVEFTLHPVGFYVGLSHHLSVKDRLSVQEQPIRGLFTNHFIPHHVVIGAYLGDVVSYKQVNKLRHRYYQHPGSSRIMYFFENSVSHLHVSHHVYKHMPHMKQQFKQLKNQRKWVVDAFKHGSFLRYVNAYNAPDQENCQFVQVNEYMMLISTRDIQPHEELIAFYGDNTNSIMCAHPYYNTVMYPNTPPLHGSTWLTVHNTLLIRGVTEVSIYNLQHQRVGWSHGIPGGTRITLPHHGYFKIHCPHVQYIVYAPDEVAALVCIREYVQMWNAHWERVIVHPLSLKHCYLGQKYTTSVKAISEPCTALNDSSTSL